MSRTARRWAGWLIAVGAGLSGSLAPSSPVVTTEAWLATGDVVMIASQLECRPEIQVLLLLDEKGPDAEQNGLVNHLFRLQAEPGDVLDGWVRVLQDAEVRWALSMSRSGRTDQPHGS